jgi:hypothetical protein
VCGPAAREQLEDPPTNPWREIRAPTDLHDPQRACVSCMRTIFPEAEA